MTDNVSAHRSHEAKWFGKQICLSPKHLAVGRPQSNGITEIFVKIMKRDYISLMPKPNGLTAVKNLAAVFEHYNEWYPHSTLGYRSPQEYKRCRTHISDKKFLEI
ncbi:transposase [Providencia stuartii]